MQRLNLQSLWMPLAILTVLLLSYGLLIPGLGYYGKDWLFLAGEHPQLAGVFRDALPKTYPLTAWLYASSNWLFGSGALLWHSSAFLLRALATLSMWICLKNLWPARPRQAALIALLFSVYPAFTGQAAAVTMLPYWITLAGYFASMTLMIQSMRSSRMGWIYTSLSLLVMVLTCEIGPASLGLELLRPVFLLLALAQRTPDRPDLSTLIKRWLPYGGIAFYYFVWRFTLPNLASGTIVPGLLQGLSLEKLEFALQDSFYLLAEAWYETLRPELINIKDTELWLSLLIGAAVAAVAGLTVYKRPAVEETPGYQTAAVAFPRQAILLGGLAVVCAPLPVWLSNQQAFMNPLAAHGFLLAAVGASILCVGLLEWLADEQRPKQVLVLLLFLVAAAYQVRKTNEYRWDWTKQQRFYAQMAWRAPHLLPGTLVIADSALFKFTDDLSLSVALNLLYPTSQPGGSLGAWFHRLDPAKDPDILDAPATFFNASLYVVESPSYKFTASKLDALLIDYNPEQGRCLRIISTLDEYNPGYSALLRRSSGYSNLTRISSSVENPSPPLARIFGSEPEHTWCYLYQKASLAAQSAAWADILRLAQQAQATGLSPNDPMEWLPFIQGYAMLGRWGEAIRVSDLVFRGNRLGAPQVCALWDGILAHIAVPEDIRTEISARKQKYDCTEN